ncbi:FeoC-like transcriptional regulator [Alkalinema pantanalense CENA528]|uniref:FeoC-like transcriptional regulator n=1 Tax=Alkalinema pantanalense TaxID=1620705 RepID=UPI003D6F7FDE
MLLQELQTYLRTHHHSSLQEMSQHSQSDADALRGMLDHLIRKGRVQKSVRQSCNQCHCCPPESLEMYTWVESHPSMTRPITQSLAILT